MIYLDKTRGCAMEEILKYVYRSARLKLALKIISAICVFSFVGAFAVVLVFAFMDSLVFGAKLLCFSAIPFLLVTLSRKFIDSKRPYEVYDFCEEKPREKRGEGFPSRHVFSAFLIATLSYTVSLFLAIPLAIVGVLLAVSRVFLGIHFPRDVIAGATVGIISGIIGILLLSL